MTCPSCQHENPTWVELLPRVRSAPSSAWTAAGGWRSHARRVAQRSQWGQVLKHLATATTMYREMDMRYWREQAGAELGELAH